jgi:hypothetical protein
MVLTASASWTFSNCLETVATAFAILCLVTNITSESDQPYTIEERKNYKFTQKSTRIVVLTTAVPNATHL